MVPRPLRRWWSRRVDASIDRLLRNAGILLAGTSGAAALGFVSLALAARSLGPADFGLLVLITTYVAAIDRLFNLQSWQSVIKFGAESIEHSRTDRLHRIVKLGLLLDVATALLGTAMAVGGVGIVGHWMSWDAATTNLAGVYSLVVLLHLSGTAVGVLRLLDCYSQIARYSLTAAMVKLALAAAAFASDAGVIAWLAVWAAGDALHHLLALATAARNARGRGYSPAALRRSSLRGVMEENPGLWSFVWTASISNFLRLGTTELDVMMVGAVLGAPTAGSYRIVKRLASVIALVTNPLHQAIYPDLVRIWARGDRGPLRDLIVSAVASGAALGTAAWFAFLVFGYPLILIALGPNFGDVFVPALVYLLGTALATAEFSFQPTMLATGYARFSLGVLSCATAGYLAMLLILMPSAGLTGAAVAFVGFHLLWAVPVVWLLKRRILKPRNGS